MADRSIKDLVRAAAVGDEEAWHEIVERHSALVWSVVRGHRLADSDAGDAFQTTWLRLVENLGGLREPEHLPAWLATTARRECLRLIKRRDREVPDLDAIDSTTSGTSHLLGVSEHTDHAPDAAVLRRERDAELLDAYQRLPERCQALLRLYLADPPLSYAEIAGVLDMPVGSVGPSRGRCLAHLRSLMQAQAHPPHGGA